MADINSYALDLELNLVSNASATLDDTVDLLGQVQAQIADVSKSIGGSLSSSALSVADSISNIAAASANAQVAASNMAPKMAAVAASAGNAATAHEDMQDTLRDVLEHVEDITDELTDHEQMLADVLEHNEDINENLVDQSYAYRAISDELTSAYNRTRDLMFGVEGLTDAFRALVDEEVKFTTVNYRMYGTQREIINLVNKTTREYGLLRKEALEAYSVLAGGLRIPEEELGKYVDLVVKFEKVTGVTAQTTGDWIRQMRLAGFGTKEIDRELNRLVETMRQAGMTAEEIQNIMRDETSKTASLTLQYGKKNMKAVREQNSVLLAGGKALGVEASAVMALTDAIDNNVHARGVLMSFAADEVIADTELTGAYRDRALAMSGFSGFVNDLNKRLPAGAAGSAAFNIQMQRMGKMVGLTSNHLAQFRTAYEEAAAQGKDTGQAIDKLFKSMLGADWERQNQLANQYAQSMNTIRDEVGRVFGKMKTYWSELAIAIAPIIIMLVKNVLEPLVDVMGTIVSVVTAVFKGVMILLFPFVMLFKAVSNLFMGFWSVIHGALEPFLEIISTIYTALYDNVGMSEGFAKVMRGVGKVVGYIVTAAFRPFIWAAKLLAWVIKSAGGTLSFFGKIVSAIFSPISFLFTTIKGAVTSVSKGFSLFTGTSTKLWSSITALFGPLTSVSGMFKTLGGAVKSTFGWLVDGVQSAKTSTFAFFGGLWDSLKSSKLVSGTLGKLYNAFKTLGGAVKSTFGWLVDGVQSAKTSTFAFFGGLWDSLKSISKLVSGALGKLYNTFKAGFISALEVGLQPLMDAFGDIYKTISESVSEVWEALQPLWEAFSEVYNAIFGGAEKAGDALDPVTGAVGSASDVASVFETIVSALVPTIQFLGKVIGWVVTAAVLPLTVAIKVASAVIYVIANVVKWFVGLAVAVITPIVSIFAWLINKAREASDWFSKLGGEGTLLGSVMSKLWSALSPVTGGLKALGSTISWVVGWFGAGGAGLIEETTWATKALQLLMSPVRGAAVVLNFLGDSVSRVVGSISTLTKSFAQLAQNWDTLLIGSAALMMIGTSVLTASVMILSGSTMLAAAGPMFAVGMTAMAAGLWLLNLSKIEKMSNALMTLSKSILSVSIAQRQLVGLGNAMRSIKDAVIAMSSGVLSAISSYVSYLKSMIVQVQLAITQTGAAVSAMALQVVGSMMRVFSVIPAIGTAVSAMASQVVGSMMRVFSVIPAIGAAVSAMASQVVGSMMRVFSVIPGIGAAVMLVSLQLTVAANYIKSVGGLIYNAIFSIATAIIAGFNQIISAGDLGYQAILYTASVMATGADAILGVGPWLAHAYDTIAAIVGTGIDRIQSQAVRALGILVPIQFLAGGLGLSVYDLLGLGEQLDTPIAAETISQVQVLTDQDSSSEQKDSREHQLQQEQVILLRAIDGRISNLGENKIDLNEITDLLKEWLPKIGKEPNKLGTRMNDWT